MATDGHGGDFVPTGPTHDQPYEPDKFAVKTILAVPAAVIVTGVIAFVVTTLIFGAFFAPKKFEPQPASEAGAAANSADMNDRFDQISSTNPKARVLQPRLEGIQKRAIYGDEKDKITAEMITTQPTKDGNSPRYHAEDLRPDRVAATAKGSTDPQTGVVRVPVNDAIRMAGDPSNAAWAKALPSREGALPLDPDANWDRPKESNGGQVRVPQPSKPAAPKKEGGPGDKKEEGAGEKKEPEKK